MNLRISIQQRIENTPSPDEAAIAVCLLLEDFVGLAGEGWYDDDPVMLARLKADVPDQSELNLADLDASSSRS